MGQELSLPGVQEPRSLASQRFRGPGVPEAGCSGVWQGPEGGSELARGARSSNSSLRFLKVKIKLDASSARMVVGCKSSQ